MRMNSRFALVFLLALVACGGGGRNSEEKISGVWSGTVSLVDDTCGIVGPLNQFVSFTHLVNESGTEVVLDNGLTTFTGTRQSDNSFRVSTERGRAPLVDGQTCVEEIVWRYEEIDRQSAPFVVRSSTVTCTEGDAITECQFAFSGSAFKNSGGGGPIVFATDSGDNSVSAQEGSGVPDTAL